ncbi:MAG: hypothetical protein ABFS34_02155 [Gemmatimonadota bacterium]
MIRMHRLGWRTLDLELGTARGVSVRILERPGRWLDDARRARLLGEMREVAAPAAGGGELPYGVLSGDDERWNRAILTTLRDRHSGRLVGFNAMSLLDVELDGASQDVLHLGLLVLDSDHRGRGLSRLSYGLSIALVLARRGGRSVWVSSVTQVPAIAGMVAQTLAHAHPAPGSAPTSAHVRIARQIMRRHRSAFGVGEDAGFDERRFVITNAYTGGSDHLKKSYFEAPKHRNPAINAWCHRELDYERGDDVLQIGRFTARVAWGCVRRFLAGRATVAPNARDLGRAPTRTRPREA